jgi:hypothetical protein
MNALASIVQSALSSTADQKQNAAGQNSMVEETGGHAE